MCLSRSYICYCVKAGLIRAIHSSTGDKTLLRGHETPVVDLRFSSTNDSVLCTVDAGSGRVPHVFVWRLVVKESLEFEKVCTLQLPASLVIGHPLSEEIWNVSHGNEMCIFSTKLVRQESPADFSSGWRAYSDSSLSLRLQSEITGSTLITFSGVTLLIRRLNIIYVQECRFRPTAVYWPLQLQRAGGEWSDFFRFPPVNRWDATPSSSSVFCI